MKIRTLRPSSIGLVGSGRGAVGTCARWVAGGWSSAAAPFSRAAGNGCSPVVGSARALATSRVSGSARGSGARQEELMRPRFSVRHGTALLLALLLAAAPGATRAEAQGTAEE